MQISIKSDLDYMEQISILNEWYYKPVSVTAVDVWHKRADVRDSYEMSKLEMQKEIELYISGDSDKVRELETRLKFRFG